MPIELRHLRYFVAVADELSVRRAARRLHVSQPPLSRQIRDLEDEIGAKLFARTKQKLTLTPAGERFREEAKEILSRAKRAVQLAQAASRGESGQLIVAFLPSTGGLFLPSAIRAFRVRFPLVDLDVVNLLPQEQITALMDRRIDLGFVPLPIVELNPALKFEPVQEVEMMVALPPGHRLARQKRLTLPRLANEPFVFFERASGLLHEWTLNLCREAGFEPPVSKVTESAASVLELVSAGFGVGLMPALFRRFPSDAVFRPLPSTTPTLHLSLAWRRDNNSLLLGAFLEIMRAMLKRSGADLEKPVKR